MKRTLALALGALVVLSVAAPAFARAGKRKSRGAKPKPAVAGLAEPAFTSILEVTGGPEEDLRDSAAAVPAPAPAAAKPATLLDRLAAQRNVGTRRIDGDMCQDAARNLRFIVSVAKADLREMSPADARRKFLSGLKRELDALHRTEPAEDTEVAVMATQAEMELEAALKELEERPLRPDTLAAASRAAAHLDAAARLLVR